MSFTWGLLGKHVILLLDLALAGEMERVSFNQRKQEDLIKAFCVYERLSA